MQPSIVQPELVTAARLAEKLGITKQAVRKLIGSVPPCGNVKVKGQDTAAWTLAALPPSICSRIAAARRARGFRTDAEFLASDVKPYEAPLPFNQLPQAAQIEADKWMQILSPLLARQHTTPPSELLAAGIDAAQRILGEPISEDTFRRRFDLAVKRDKGFEQWTRLDYYVAPNVYEVAKQEAAKAAAPVVIVPAPELWPDLPSRLELLENKLQPTAEDRADLFDAAFRQLEALAASNSALHRKQSKLKGWLVDILHKAVPALAVNTAALRRTFDRKLTLWRVNGRKLEAILDARDNSGREAKRLCPTCLKNFIAAAGGELPGNESQAFRRMILPPSLGGQRGGEKGFCNECASLWHYDVRKNKSYVPHSLRRDTWPQIEEHRRNQSGDKTNQHRSPFNRRRWNDLGPGDSFEADDVTLNHYWWEQDEAGRFYVGRGECLMLMDRRTDYPIAYLMISGVVDEDGNQQKATYNSGHIRSLILRGNDAVGVPHNNFWLENGVWKSRLIDGEPRRGWELNPWRRTEHGLRDPRLGIGIEDAEAIRHALPGNSRTKRIEGVFRIVQERMRPQLGFAGFNERLDKREKLQDFLRRVRSGKEHPGNELLSKADYLKILDDELMSFAREPQNGDRLPGVSPLEAWQNGIDGKPGIKERPLRKLEDSDRALLSTHRRIVTVGDQGIRLKMPGQRRPSEFWGDALLPYKFRSVEVAINLEEPELLHCLPKNGEFFTLRERVLPSSTATREQLAETSAARRRWIKAGKVAFDNLPHPLRTNITRDDLPDSQSFIEGNFINAETAAHREAKQAAAKTEKRLRKLEGTLGVNLPRTASPARQAELEAAARRLAARRAGQIQHVTP